MLDPLNQKSQTNFHPVCRIWQTHQNTGPEEYKIYDYVRYMRGAEYDIGLLVVAVAAIKWLTIQWFTTNDSRESALWDYWQITGLQAS